MLLVWRRGLTTSLAAAAAPVKRKRAVLFGYCGSDFCGSQTQRSERGLDLVSDTVEDALHLALFKAGAISPDNFASLQKIGWTRSSRTDRGVHAATQLISAKLMVPDEAGEEEEDKFCELVNSHLPSSVRVYGVPRVQGGFNARHCTDSRRYSYLIPEHVLRPTTGASDQVPVLPQLRDVLQRFVGTHSFHNFTENMSPVDPRATRYIQSFSAEEHLPGVVLVQVSGQSFLKHHIRRMIGFAVAMMRTGDRRMGSVEEALRKDRVVARGYRMPFAPAEPLFLDMMFLGEYGAKQERTHSKLPRIDFGNPVLHDKHRAMLSDVILPRVLAEYEPAFERWLREEEHEEESFPPKFEEPDTSALNLREAKRRHKQAEQDEQLRVERKREPTLPPPPPTTTTTSEPSTSERS